MIFNELQKHVIGSPATAGRGTSHLQCRFACARHASFMDAALQWRKLIATAMVRSLVWQPPDSG